MDNRELEEILSQADSEFGFAEPTSSAIVAEPAPSEDTVADTIDYSSSDGEEETKTPTSGVEELPDIDFSAFGFPQTNEETPETHVADMFTTTQETAENNSDAPAPTGGFFSSPFSTDTSGTDNSELDETIAVPTEQTATTENENPLTSLSTEELAALLTKMGIKVDTQNNTPNTTPVGVSDNEPQEEAKTGIFTKLAHKFHKTAPEKTPIEQLATQPLATPIVIGVTSFKGGVGKTTISTALAIAAGYLRHRKTLHIDADLHGAAAKRATGTIVEDITRAAHILTNNPTLGVSNFVTPGNHADFLAAPNSLANGPVTPEQLATIIAAAKRDNYDIIIIDFPIASVGQWWEASLRLCDTLIMVGDAHSVDSVHRFTETLPWLSTVYADHLNDKLTLVVSHTAKDRKNAFSVEEWVKFAQDNWKAEALEMPYSPVLHTGRAILAEKIDAPTMQQLTLLLAAAIELTKG